ISWREIYFLSETATMAPINPLLADVVPTAMPLSPGEHPFGAFHVWRFLRMHIQPAIYLSAILADYRSAGGQVAVREFSDARSLNNLAHPVIVNCTGLGAGALFNDAGVVPIKGQLTVLAPQPEVEYITIGPGDLVMMPRQDGVILGGTHERGEWSLEPDPAAS